MLLSRGSLAVAYGLPRSQGIDALDENPYKSRIVVVEHASSLSSNSDGHLPACNSVSGMIYGSSRMNTHGELAPSRPTQLHSCSYQLYVTGYSPMMPEDRMGM